jgi:hypothetical protein
VTWRTLCGIAVLCVTGFSGVPRSVDALEKPGSLSGRVFRSDTGQPIAGATVVLLDGSESQAHSAKTTTDASGEYQFSEVRPGRYKVTVRASYEDQGDAPCQLLMGKTAIKGSTAFLAHDGGRAYVQVLVDKVRVKGGAATRQDFDLVCRSMFEE